MPGAQPGDLLQTRANELRVTLRRCDPVLGLLDTRDDIARPRKHAPWSDQREQALEGEPRVPGNAPQRRRPQTNVLVVREGQLTTVSVPQHAVGSALPDHDEASALEGTDYPPGG